MCPEMWVCPLPPSQPGQDPTLLLSSTTHIRYKFNFMNFRTLEFNYCNHLPQSHINTKHYPNRLIPFSVALLYNEAPRPSQISIPVLVGYMQTALLCIFSHRLFILATAVFFSLLFLGQGSTCATVKVNPHLP